MYVIITLNDGNTVRKRLHNKLLFFSTGKFLPKFHNVRHLRYWTTLSTSLYITDIRDHVLNQISLNHVFDHVNADFYHPTTQKIIKLKISGFLELFVEKIWVLRTCFFRFVKESARIDLKSIKIKSNKNQTEKYSRRFKHFYV